MDNTGAIGEIVTDLYNYISRIEEKSLSEGVGSDVSSSEIHIIEKLGPEGTRTMSRIAKSLRITLATFTTACDRLEQKNLIVRERDANDRRRVHVKLTPMGLIVYRYHQEFRRNMMEAILSDLDYNEREVLGSSIQKLRDFLTDPPMNLKALSEPEQLKLLATD